MASVLIVDDSAIDRRIAGSCIEAQDLVALYAENGGEALRAIEAQHPDLVVTDLQMPAMDGLELVAEIRRCYPEIPVILMTAHGSEEVAVRALQAGAINYVPKKNLKRDLGVTLKAALEVAKFRSDRELVSNLMARSESYYVLGYQSNAPRALVGHLQEVLGQMGRCDETDLTRVGTALREALANAIEHGNLELDSSLREAGDGSYYRLRAQRSTEAPYFERRVHVTARFTCSDATFVVRDEGSGFDHSNLPDPTDPKNLLKLSGRGLLLIRTLMDEVTFDESGNEITMVKRQPPADRQNGPRVSTTPPD